MLALSLQYESITERAKTTKNVTIREIEEIHVSGKGTGADRVLFAEPWSSLILEHILFLTLIDLSGAFSLVGGRLIDGTKHASSDFDRGTDCMTINLERRKITVII